MTLEIVRPGMFTTIQDRGRFEYRRDGVVTSGAMDQYSWQVANLLVGNTNEQPPCRENNAALEFYLVGPSIDFHEDAIIAVYGGQWNAMLDGQPFPRGRPYTVRQGQRLEIQEAFLGCWGYLAIHGGLEIAPTLGSRSTHVRSAIGGFHGRCINRGDKIPIVVNNGYTHNWPTYRNCYLPWHDLVYLDGSAAPASSAIRIISGAHWDLLDEGSRLSMLSDPWFISKKSDRMGYRLESFNLAEGSEQRVLKLASPFEMFSEPTAIGTVQLPPAGEPIVLMADAATTGGYPRIAHIAEVDLPRFAQQPPGTAIRFELISHGQSRLLQLARNQTMKRLKGMLDYLRRSPEDK